MLQIPRGRFVSMFVWLLLGIARPSEAAPMVADGKLVGATSVNVGGTLYDVTFVDTTCIAVFSGCDSPRDFDFTNPTHANAAASALLAQVFGSGDPFDMQPELTFGCTSLSTCEMWIPYGIGPFAGTFSASAARNSFPFGSDGISFVAASASSDFGGALGSSAVFADFTPVTTTVPEPASLLILACGVAGFAAKARRRRTAMLGRPVAYGITPARSSPWRS